MFSIFSVLQPTSVLADTLLEQAQEAGYQIPEANLPEAGIVIEAENGQILWEQDAEKEINPVGLSNLMTLYLTFEALKDTDLTLDTLVTTTDNQQAIGQLATIRNNNVIAGVEYSIADLIQLAAVPSSNVATIMLSHTIDEQDGPFVTKMNQKAEELGMTQTTFNTATGVPAIEFNGYYQPEGYDFYTGNQSTAKDLAILTYHLIKDFPELLEITNQSTITVLPDSLYEESFDSENELLAGGTFASSGVDGLKYSGDTESGYHGITTARRDGWHTITVLLGVGDLSNPESKQSLFALSDTLLTSVFDTYSYTELLGAGSQTVNEETIKVENDFYVVTPKDQEASFTLTDGEITLENELPVVSDTVTPIKAAYVVEESELEQNLERFPFLTTLLNIVEITKLTILSAGAIVLGIIFLLMSAFIPGHTEEEDGAETEFETRRRQKKRKKRNLPVKQILVVVGLLSLLSGVVILSIQYLI